MRRLPPLNALRAFEAAFRHRSFTRAAEELAVSHAAIGRHVRGLEARLGLRLFRRDGRGVVPTAEGRLLADAAAEAFERIETAVGALTASTAPGLLRLSVEPGFAVRWLAPRLAGFRRLHPRIEVALDPTAALSDLRHDPVDLAIRYGAGGWSDVVAEKLVDVVTFPVCAPALATRLSRPADLAGLVLLHEETTRHWSGWLDAQGVGALVDASRGPRLSDTALALEMAVLGHGVALGDNVTCAGDLATGRLVRPFAAALSAGAYWLVMPQDRRLSPAAGDFRAWLLAAMEDFLRAAG